MNLTNEFIKVLKLKHTDKGHFGEQLGMAWLLKNGYWVSKTWLRKDPLIVLLLNKAQVKLFW